MEETKGQVVRLRQVFEFIGKKPTGKHCEGMEGVIAEGTEALEEDADDASFDSGLIGAALRTEHYEIAGYHAAIGMARTLGMNDVVGLLKQNLDEEVATAKPSRLLLKRFSRRRPRKKKKTRTRSRSRR